MIYKVIVKEVHNQPVWIEAKSEKEAIEKVEAWEGNDLGEPTCYDYTLDSDTWQVIQEDSQNIIETFEAEKLI